MAEVLLFYHAQGLTPGVVSFADTLRRAGTSYTPPICSTAAPSIHWRRV